MGFWYPIPQIVDECDTKESRPLFDLTRNNGLTSELGACRDVWMLEVSWCQAVGMSSNLMQLEEHQPSNG
jgi:hypothetical protein